jgi:GNAT superfamily N-acetyltransferase
MVHELAEDENLLQKCVATEEQFHKPLFCEKPAAETLLGELDGKPIAFALFFHNFSTLAGKPCLYLEDLYIKPPFRRRGIGKTILQRLEHLALLF